MTCLGSNYGDCCSQYSYCGSTDAYCGSKCQPGFGRCKDSSSRSSSGLRSSTESMSSPLSSSIRTPSSIPSSSTSPTGLSSLPTSSSSSAPPVPSVAASSSLGSDVSTKPSSTAFPPTVSSSLSSAFSSPLSSSEPSSSTAFISTSSTDTTRLISSSAASSTTTLTPTPVPMSIMESTSVFALSSSSLASSSTTSSETSHTSTTTVSRVLSSSSFTYSESFTLMEITPTLSLPSVTISSDISLSSSTITDSPISASASGTIASSVDPTNKESVTTTSDESPSLSTTASSVSSDASATSSSAEISHLSTSTATSIMEESNFSITASTTLGMGSSDSSEASSTLVITSTSAVTSESSIMSSSSAIAPDLGCNPRPRATCNRVRDCPVSTNALVAPSSTYRSVPVAAASSVPYQKITIPINNLTVGIEYVLTFYSATEILLSSGSNSCCNITAYMDNIAISRYCVGYYYTLAYIQNGPYAAATSKLIRSPAIIYRPTVPNPALQFNVVCPVSDTSVTVGAPKLQDVALVPRCTCVEENLLQSLQTQPRNAAFNGNFADYDATQENPVLGWTSQESWRGQVLPVPYSGTSQAVDTSNKGAVVLFGPFASLYRTISGLTPFAPYNVSILSSSPGVKNDCNLTVKFDDKIILAMPFSVIALRAYTHNFTILYPKATAGVLWVGNICKNDFNATRRGNEYNAIRIDDVSFARIGCDDPAQSIASITSMTSVLTVPTGS